MTLLRGLTDVFRIRQFSLLGATVLGLGLAYSFTFPYLSLFALNEAHISSHQLGIYMAVSAVSGVIVTTLLGRLSDRGFNRKYLILLSLVCAALGDVVLSQVRSFEGMLINTLLLLSIGRAAFPQTFTFARAKFEHESVTDITLAINTVRMFFSLAWVVGPAIGAMLLLAFDFTGLYLTAAGVLILAALWALPIAAGATPHTRTTPKTALLPYLRQPEILAIIAGFGLLFLCSNMNIVVLPLFAVSTLHARQAEVGLLLGLAAGIEIPLMLASAVVAAKFGKTRLIIVATLLYAGYFLSLALAQQPWQLYPAQILSAMVISIVMGLGMSYFQDLLPGEPGVSTALYANAMTIGAILSGVVFSAIAGPYGYRGVLTTCLVCCLVAGVLLGYANRRLRNAQPPTQTDTRTSSTDLDQPDDAIIRF